MNQLPDDLSVFDGHSTAPWQDHGPGTDIFVKGVGASPLFIVKCDSGVYGPHGPDRELIKASPFLLAEVKRLRELDRRKQALIDFYSSYISSVSGYLQAHNMGPDAAVVAEGERLRAAIKEIEG